MTLLTSLLSKHPLEWDAQTVLPPLITLLAAYLALAGLYRTTTWMIRTSFWFMKWAIILGTLVAGIGWYMGVSQAQVGGLTNSGVMSYVGNIALDMINGPNRNAAGGERTARSRTSQTHKEAGERPKPWESFSRHREWEYSEDQTAERDGTSNLDDLINNLIGAAGQVLGSDSWWTGMKNVMKDSEGRSNQGAEGKTDRTQSKTSKSRSR